MLIFWFKYKEYHFTFPTLKGVYSRNLYCTTIHPKMKFLVVSDILIVIGIYFRFKS